MKIENPSAFPQSLNAEGPFGGMTLRDWFAGQALAGLSSAADANGDWTTEPRCCAVTAYAYADAMLAARTEGKPHD